MNLLFKMTVGMHCYQQGTRVPIIPGAHQHLAVSMFQILTVEDV